MAQKTQNNKKTVLLILYLEKRTSYDCGFWCICVKLSIQNFFFHFFKILIFWGKGKNDPKLIILVCYTLYLGNCRLYHQDFWYTHVK